VKKLIEVSKNVIGNSEVNAVSARELYLGLGFDKSNWAKWSALNIEQNEFFSQGVDFIKLVTNTSANIPNPPKDYAISIDFAKHISMMAKTTRGHEYRNYFLELEKQPVSLVTVATELEGAIKIANLFGFSGNQALLSANKATKNKTGIDCVEYFGFELIAPVKQLALTPSEIGVRIGGISGQKVNQLLKDAGYQVDYRAPKNVLYWPPTDKASNLFELFDTPKKHSDGTPIKQIKWFESVIELITV